MIRQTCTALCALTAIALFGQSAAAAPILQLDIAGGRYDDSTKTIVGTSNPFVLTAVLTPPPGTTQAQIDRALGETFYISAAVSPQYGPEGGNLGSFMFAGSQVNVTQDMVYGKPPIEQVAELQGFDSGDLQGHDVYPTYFTEFAFRFSPLSRALEYDSALAPGGLTPSAAGSAYYASFAVDTRLLDPKFTVHFDLYNTVARNCGLNTVLPGCVDIDVNYWAPFTHDAQSPPVPEPASMLLLGTGLGAAALRRRRRARS
jgi:PEP-CTERM motif-containing protein